MLTAGGEGIFVPGYSMPVQHPYACPGAYTNKIGGWIRGPHSCTAMRSAAKQVQKIHPEIFGKQQQIVIVNSGLYLEQLTLKK